MRQALFGAPQRVVGADNGAWCRVLDVGDVWLPARQGARFVLQGAVDALLRAFEGVEPVAFDGDLPGNSLLGFGDLLFDSAEALPGPVGRIPRVVPIDGWLADDLGEYLTAHPRRLDPAAPLFPGRMTRAEAKVVGVVQTDRSTADFEIGSDEVMGTYKWSEPINSENVAAH